MLAAVGDRAVRSCAILSSLITLVLSVLLVHNFTPGGGQFQFAEMRPWIPVFGAAYILAVDGLSVWLILLSSLLGFLVVINSCAVERNVRGYLVAQLFLQVGLLGTLTAIDGLLFYVFWELMLIPMYFIIGAWGGERCLYAAIKFVLFTALGSVLMLLAMLYLSFLWRQQAGSPSFFLGDWAALTLSGRQEALLFAAFALAFAIKIPLVPLHTWLPDAHVEAPTGGSVILAGVMLKMGLYGLLRFGTIVFPAATLKALPVFAALGVAGIIYGALAAWVQTDMKKLVAYSSISHLGFCVLGFAALNVQALQGSMLQMLNHGVSTGALFFLVGVLYERKHDRHIASYGGVAARMPMYAAAFALFTFSSIGLPLTNGFIGEFLILLGTFAKHPLLALLACSGVVLAAVYMLSLYRRVFFGPLDEEKNGDLEDLKLREILTLVVLAGFVFFVGLYPQPVLKDLEAPARSVLFVIEGAAK